MKDAFVTKYFAARLRKLRELAGLSQDQLAKELKISRGSVSYYENAERTPDIEVLDNVSMFFGVPVNYLLGYTNTAIEKNELASMTLGLSDKSIEKLENAWFDTELVSQIIEHDRFDEFMKRFSDFVLLPKFYNDRLDVDRYLIFELTNLFMQILHDIKRRQTYSVMSESDLRAHRERFDAAMRKYDDMKAELENIPVKELDEALKRYDVVVRGQVRKALIDEDNNNGEHHETDK